MENSFIKQTSALPTLAVRGMVVFPNTLVHFDIVREKSLLALENAMVNKQLAFVTMQTDPTIENPKTADIEEMGTICKSSQVVKMPNNTVRVLVEGIKRAKICQILKTKPFFVSSSYTRYVFTPNIPVLNNAIFIITLLLLIYY